MPTYWPAVRVGKRACPPYEIIKNVFNLRAFTTCFSALCTIGKKQKKSPQRHRGHRVKTLYIVNFAEGEINKKNLCALCASVVSVFEVGIKKRPRPIIFRARPFFKALFTTR